MGRLSFWHIYIYIYIYKVNLCIQTITFSFPIFFMRKDNVIV